LVILLFQHSFSLFYLFIPFIVLLIILITASFYVNSQFFIKTICRIPAEKKEIILSFDDGPDPVITPMILGVLKKYNVTAVFFCIGKKAALQPDLVAEIKNNGHLIGNHSYSHAKWFDFLSPARMAEDIKRADNVLTKITGNKVIYFRPPYGVTNFAVKKALKNFKYLNIGWSLRSFDTITTSKEKTLDKLKKQLKAGYIVLFHDNIAITPSILEEFIGYLHVNGFKIASLDTYYK